MSDEFAPAEGYDRLGRLMGELPETAIFRRFGALSAEDLLYRQAELVELEKTLRDCQKKDKESSHYDRQHYGFNWDLLQYSASEHADEGNDPRQWQTILAIREKLESYHKAVLRYNKVYGLKKPLERQLENLNTWMERPSMGHVYLEGSDRETWKKPDLDDMMSLQPESAEDGFTTNQTLALVKLYNSVVGRHVHKEESEKNRAKDHLRNTIRYRDEGTFRVLKVLTTMVACLLPVAGIAVLYAVQYMPKRLGIIAAFVTLFSFALIMTTGARMKEIFGATAAFAAVLVVFVGTNGGDCNCSVP